MPLHASPLRWQRPKTRSFIRLAWPALGAWVLTLACAHAWDNAWVRLGCILAGTFFYVLAFAYVFVAATANAPAKTRLLACAANLSAPVLAIGLTALGLWSPRGGKLSIAEAKCREYYDAAITWEMIKRKEPDYLKDMEAPLSPGDVSFIRVEDDPWGNVYVLETQGEGRLVRSFGPDGKRGTADDIICAGRE